MFFFKGSCLNDIMVLGRTYHCEKIAEGLGLNVSYFNILQTYFWPFSCDPRRTPSNSCSHESRKSAEAGRSEKIPRIQCRKRSDGSGCQRHHCNLRIQVPGFLVKASLQHAFSTCVFCMLLRFHRTNIGWVKRT